MIKLVSSFQKRLILIFTIKAQKYI